mgnify:CR=1 FL=1
MNKTEKIWAAVLAAALVGYFAWRLLTPQPVPAPQPQQTVQAPAAPTVSTPVTLPQTNPAKPVVLTAAQERFYTLENEQVRLTFSDQGARLIKAEMLQYRTENREDAPHVTLETDHLLNLTFEQAAPYLSYTAAQPKGDSLRFTATLPNGVELTRTMTLQTDYMLNVQDTFRAPQQATLAPYQMSAGALTLPADAPGDALGADFLAQGERKPEYCESQLGKILGARSAFLGCGTSSDPAGVPLSGVQTFAAPQTWVALKNRFFVSLTMPAVGAPAALQVSRDGLAKTVRIENVSAAFTYPALQLQAGVPTEVATRLYIGPKKLGYLNAFGAHADAIMDFGFFSWVCKILLPILNFFHALIPNYGVAIILLTLLVRLVFWPLTHKSTVAMRKMSAIQPKIKALQQQFKDQPQKLQQETFKLYREHQVNPFSSCLPMLVQIPIFIALFVVLRSAIELRFASFLWISDLSQPENLFAGVLPVPLNILPILTAVTMGLQTHLSPSTGDPAQKKMMTWMMPAMLLFMFYSMASALCLYWTVSQGLSILQMWLIRRSTARAEAQQNA